MVRKYKTFKIIEHRTFTSLNGVKADAFILLHTPHTFEYD